jgi:membrane protein required for colicin V production
VVVARMFGNQAAELLTAYISLPSVRLMVAYGVLFLVTMIVGGMVSYLVSQVVEMTGLSGTDRLLGMIFGLARGGLIVIVAIAVLARMPVTEDDWWKRSKTIPHFLRAAESIQTMLFERWSTDINPVQKT